MTTQDTTQSSFLKDLNSGFFVFLIALPLCLGISIASGFPPVAGILTAIVGGVLCSFLGSSPLTIKGPAAGLIVIAIGAVQDLGGGDPVIGYKKALAVGAVAALLQIALSFFGAATLGIAMSPSVVHGMLAAIGVIIISKQAHTLLGASPQGKEPLELLLEIPRSLLHANPEVLIIGAISLCILYLLPHMNVKKLKAVPLPLIVLVFAIPLGYYFDLRHGHEYLFYGQEYHVGPEFLIQLPASLLDAIVHPDFSTVFSATSLKYIALFMLIGSIESVLSVMAVDSLDPEKRVSNLNRDLFAVGAGNLVCSLIGGLPMISEIVRSKANIDAGAQSKWSNVVHGGLLLVFVALFPNFLGHIPLAALAAMLIYTGFRLASPSEFTHAYEVGKDQLFIFLVTFVTTLTVDLLAGVALGIVVKLMLHRFRGSTFRSLLLPKTSTTINGSEATIVVEGAAVFTNLLQIRSEMLKLNNKVSLVHLDLCQAELVDHTFLTRIHELSNEMADTSLDIVGLDNHSTLSEHPHATRKRSHTNGSI